jgi:hypothetical protein
MMASPSRPLTVRELSKLLEDDRLDNDDQLIGTELGNIQVIRKNQYIGYINMRSIAVEDRVQLQGAMEGPPHLPSRRKQK